MQSEQIGENNVGALIDLKSFEYGHDEFDWQNDMVFSGHWWPVRCWGDVAKCYTESLEEFKEEMIEEYQNHLAGPSYPP